MKRVCVDEVAFFLAVFLVAFLGGHSTAQAPLAPGDLKEYSESVAVNHETSITYKDLTTWVCRYNVGPNNNMKSDKVRQACLTYAKRVSGHMVRTYKAYNNSK